MVARCWWHELPFEFLFRIEKFQTNDASIIIDFHREKLYVEVQSFDEFSDNWRGQRKVDGCIWSEIGHNFCQTELREIE